MFENIDFIEDATNVYRTKKYIVKQIINIESHTQLDNIIISQDTYYTRTKARDKQFNKLFADKLNKNGKRLHSSSNTRKYVKWNLSRVLTLLLFFSTSRKCWVLVNKSALKWVQRECKLASNVIPFWR